MVSTRNSKQHGSRKINLEIKIETVHQQEHLGRALVVCVTIDKEEDISAKFMNAHDENELDVKFVLFKWTSTKGITNATRINCLQEIRSSI